MSVTQKETDFKTENLGLDPEVFAKILEINQDNHYAHLTGIKLVALGPGKAIAELIVERHNSNMYETIHGGASATLADITMGLACYTKGITVMTGNINISFLAAGKAGDKIIAVGQVIRAGKTAFFAETSLEDENGRIIAKGTGTFFLKETFAEQTR
ncbi:MAG: PaaI family thioesterase [Desulfitobacteriaceae bacterium]